MTCWALRMSNALMVTSSEASVARRARAPCRPCAGHKPRGGILGHMLDTRCICWRIWVVITQNGIRYAVCVWPDTGAELATAVSQRNLRSRLS